MVVPAPTADVAPTTADGGLRDDVDSRTAPGAPSPTGSPTTPSRRGLVLPVVLLVLLAAGLVVPADGLPTDARLTFLLFGAAVVLWTASDLDDAVVAVGAAAGLVVLGVQGGGSVLGTLVDPTIWLLLGAFVIATAARTTGLAQRLAAAVASRARTLSGLFYGLTAAMVATAYVIPSTTGRAALMLPVFLALAAVLDDRRVVRALALLIPTVILLSAVASLTGAGAHLVTSGILDRTGHGGIGYAEWALYGTPFALVSSFGSAWVVQRLFLDDDERRRPVRLSADALAGADPLAPLTTGPLSTAERRASTVILLLVVLWATEGVHGLGAATVAVLGALVVVAPGVGVLRPRAALAGIEWRLLVFMAATLALGEALVSSGAAAWLVQQAAGGFDALGDVPPVAVGLIVLLSLASHLVIISRTARSSVLVPTVVLLAASLGLDPTVLAFASTAAAGFCLTLPVSAKAVMLFSAQERPTFLPRDLLRLAGVLAPAHLVLLLVFALAVWPAMGLRSDRPQDAPVRAAGTPVLAAPATPFPSTATAPSTSLVPSASADD